MPALANLNLSSLALESLAGPNLAKAKIAFTTFPYPSNAEDPVFLGIKPGGDPPPGPPIHIYTPTDPIIIMPPADLGSLSFTDPYLLGPDTTPVNQRLSITLHQATYEDLIEYYDAYLLRSGAGWMILKNPGLPIFLKVYETGSADEVVRVKAGTQADLDLLQVE